MYYACQEEIVGLHRFFQDWFLGTESPASLDRLTSALAPGFQLLGPDGSVRDRGEIITDVREGHACRRGQAFSIRIEKPRQAFLQDPLCLVLYEEWHEAPEGSRGRLSSALFRREPAAPEGVAWLHLHESWLSGPTAEDD